MYTVYFTYIYTIDVDVQLIENLSPSEKETQDSLSRIKGRARDNLQNQIKC